MTSIDPRIRVCGVCGQILDYVALDGESGFQHNRALPHSAESQDHPAVPVEPGEVFAASFCDFCFAPDPDFVLPARDFLYPGTIDGETHGSSGDWGICGGCAASVSNNQWNAIMSKVIAGMFARFGMVMSPAEISYVRANHRRLRANIAGAPRPGTYPSPNDRSQ